MSELSEQEFRNFKGKNTSLINTAAFGSAENSRKASGLHKKSSSVSTIFKNSKFKHVTQTFKRLKVRSLGINHIWLIDVVFTEKLANQIRGYQYLLIAVDILSRFVRVQRIKSKSSTAVMEGF